MVQMLTPFSPQLHPHSLTHVFCWCCPPAPPPPGYLRRTTARFTPDDPDHQHTMARPLLYEGRLSYKVRAALRSRSQAGDAAGDSSSSSSEEDEEEDKGKGSQQ